MTAHSTPDREHQQSLKQRGFCRLPAFALWGWAGERWLARYVQWQASGSASHGLLEGKSPERLKQSDHWWLFGIPGRYHRLTPLMGKFTSSEVSLTLLVQ